MSKYIVFIVFTSMIYCVVSPKHNPQSNKLKIVQTDSTRDFYIFKTMDDSNRLVIVLLAESDEVATCKPFKKFIIADSVHSTSVLKSRSRTDIAGFYLSKIDGVSITVPGKLPNIISGCNCFADR